MSFPQISNQVDFPKLEESILKFWEDRKSVV